jgi:quercetin dioxygenase-like cupin family protein
MKSSSSVSNQVTETVATQENVQTEVLQTLDLSVELELNEAGWIFQVSKHTLPSMSSLDLPLNTGWFVMNGGTLANGVASDGFSSTSQSISNTSFEPIDVLTATVLQSPSAEVFPMVTTQLHMDSPVTTAGLTMVKTWTKPLATNWSIPKSMRFRHVQLSEEGTVGLHTHDHRPSVAVVLSGTLIEHRGDGDYERVAVVSVAERHGLSHWWETTSPEAEIVVFDLIDP